MRVIEICRCGGSFEIEADDNLAVKLLDDWRDNHFCGEPEEGEEIFRDGSSIITERVDYTTQPELQIGFRGDPYEDDESSIRKVPKA